MSEISSQSYEGIAKKACSRCRGHKRKCDRVLPRCSLCIRLRYICKYETAPLSYSASTASSDPGPTILPNVTALIPPQIKAAMLQKLLNLEPKDVASTYFRVIEPWFPIISESRLRTRLPSTWDNATVDFTLLSLTIVLLCTVPESGQGTGNIPPNLMSIYLCTKSWIALVEGAGISSLDVVQSRLLTTLFEVAHGLYPAAYVSIGATVRAAEALVVQTGQGVSPLQFPTEDKKKEERITWAAILILDRYIAIESGKFPPVTRGRTVPELPYFEMPYPVCSALSASPFSPFRQFLRLFEATNLLDKVHTTLHEPTVQHSFNIEEANLIVQTLKSLKTVLHEEIPEKLKVYASGLTICTTGLLLSFENCSKERLENYKTIEYRSSTTASLDALIEGIFKMTEPFSKGQDVIDIDRIPPFIIYLVYKTAATVTERLRLYDGSGKSLEMLKSLRDFLKLVSKRWLAGERYLNLLNEDTTPRLSKAIDDLGRDVE